MFCYLPIFLCIINNNSVSFLLHLIFYYIFLYNKYVVLNYSIQKIM
ncbi:hypothetical protein CLOSTHATH_04967 [Hungatella hathewayi DSM 13479]|uniref:Uncharacterized protein n=1 Tax=Hungatella hathewayi DSM 13479 TaxID=566550 RepID=D3AMW7_9FIRM|nr:hypothetical protein CLOSTHATH_04967 [Hungatella hathewayi DSM 13479]